VNQRQAPKRGVSLVSGAIREKRPVVINDSIAHPFRIVLRDAQAKDHSRVVDEARIRPTNSCTKVTETGKRLENWSDAWCW